MSDILQYLRTRDNKYLDGNRRNYNQQNKAVDRRHYDNKRNRDQSDPAESELMGRLFSDKDPFVKNFLETTSDNQRRLLEAQEKLAVIEDRKADALQKIASFLERFQSGPSSK